MEVVGRIRGEQWEIVLPPLLDRTGSRPADPDARRRNRYARDDAAVPDLLAGRTSDGPRVRRRPAGGQTARRRHRDREAACIAARKVDDGDAVVHAAAGTCSTRDYLSEMTITRSFLSHEIAMHLGSRACPLTEELARGLCETTVPAAERWRAAGFFREPMPLPADVSWRDRFLLTAGRDPHALEDRQLTPHVLLDGLAIGESARWHDGRLWFANWGTGEIIAVGLDARREVRSGCRRRRCRSGSTGCRTAGCWWSPVQAGCCARSRTGRWCPRRPRRAEPSGSTRSSSTAGAGPTSTGGVSISRPAAARASSRWSGPTVRCARWPRNRVRQRHGDHGGWCDVDRRRVLGAAAERVRRSPRTGG